MAVIDKNRILNKLKIEVENIPRYTVASVCNCGGFPDEPEEVPNPRGGFYVRYESIEALYFEIKKFLIHN